MNKLAFQIHILGLFVERYADIGLRKDRDCIARLERDVLAGVMVEHQFAQIERDQRGPQRLASRRSITA